MTKDISVSRWTIVLATACVVSVVIVLVMALSIVSAAKNDARSDAEAARREARCRAEAGTSVQSAERVFLREGGRLDAAIGSLIVILAAPDRSEEDVNQSIALVGASSASLVTAGDAYDTAVAVYVEAVDDSCVVN